jgi:hypothetical protein
MSSQQGEAFQVLGRAGRRAAYHLLQALIEGLKAVEAVIEEVGTLGSSEEGVENSGVERIEIE